jgi:RAB protein geranylgeranyltransferase component A
LDRFDPGIRKEIIDVIIPFFIKPRIRKPENEYETLGELLLDPIDYKSFKSKCYELTETIEESLVVKSIVNSCLEWSFNYANKTKIHEVIKANERIIDNLESNPDLSKKQKTKIIKDTQKRIQELPQKTKEAYERYIVFCEEIVTTLMNEEFLFK